MSKYPDSVLKRTDTHKYCFEITEDDKEHNSDYYTLEDAKKVKKLLQEEKRVFQCYECDEDGSLEEFEI